MRGSTNALVCLAIIAAYLSGLSEPCDLEPNSALSWGAWGVAMIAYFAAIVRRP